MRTAECVTPKHPDKMCDRISDAILDAYLREDPDSRVAVETMGGHKKVFITGEVRSKYYLPTADIIKIVNDVTGEEYQVTINIDEQSNEIAQGVDTGGAGDQGIMKGYAVRETENFMPLEYEYARQLCRYLYERWPYDGKTQVTIDNEGKVKTVVASFQNVKHMDLSNAVQDFLDKEGITYHVVTHINPAGDWNIGGFEADAGLTGRKLMVDNYGPRYAIGGGAFSGKDATKVDRSGAYLARKIAVETLIERNAKEVSVELAYAIGVAEPVQATAIVDGEQIDLTSSYQLTPRDIIEKLKLKEPIFSKTAEWGHFGNGFLWR